MKGKALLARVRRIQREEPEARLALLEEALDDDDKRRYHAAKLARILDWSAEEMASYLGCGVATVYRGGGREDQFALASLAAVVRELEELFGYAAERDRAGVTVGRRVLPVEERRGLAVAWLRTPSRALGDEAPQALILRGELARVRDLVRSIDQGGSA